MSSLALSGVYSGIDPEPLIQRSLEYSRTPLYHLQDEKSAWTRKRSAVSAIEQSLRTFRSQAASMLGVDALRKVTGSSSDSAVVQVTSVAGVAGGVHRIEVDQLANSERQVHDGLASAEALVGAGAFTYTYDGVTRTLHTTDETALEDLRDLINNDAANPGVEASLLEYEADADHVTHLVLRGADTGADYGISVDEMPSALAAGGAFQVTQAAGDARFRVDGYPAGAWMTRGTNEISDVVPGATFSLRKPGEEATLTFTPVDGQVKAGLQNLINTFNALAATLRSYTGYDADTETGGVLQGDYGVNEILRVLRSELMAVAPGFASGATYHSLYDLGVEVNRDGEFELDEEAFEEAMSADRQAVLSLLSADRVGSTDSEYVQFLGALDDTEPGSYEIQVDFAPDTGAILSARIRPAGETVWETDLDIFGDVITGRAGTAYEGLEVAAIWDGVSERQSAEITVRLGLAGVAERAVQAVLDEGGVVATKVKEYEDEIDRTEDRIEQMQRRLELQEERLRAQYARMEATLARLESQTGQFMAFLQAFSSGGPLGQQTED